ncbi:MAG: Ig-like domain-containing protein [Patescibacteria group bacterium]
MSYSRITTFSLALILAFSFLPFAAYAADVEASIDESSLTTSSKKPTISGETNATTSVYVVVRSEAGKIVYKKIAKVKDGEWKAKMTRTLKRGDYEVSVYESKKSKDALDEETLTLTTKSKAKTAGKSSASLSVTSVPLLFGGNAKLGSSIPVAYVKLVNTTNATTSIEGFTLRQNGSAATDIITTFATNDDKGGSRTVVPSVFKKGEVYVPLAAELAPGQMRIFTLKAALNAASYTALGKTLVLDVVSVDTSAKLVGTLPLRGTVWTLAF